MMLGLPANGRALRVWLTGRRHSSTRASRGGCYDTLSWDRPLLLEVIPVGTGTDLVPISLRSLVPAGLTVTWTTLSLPNRVVELLEDPLGGIKPDEA